MFLHEWLIFMVNKWAKGYGKGRNAPHSPGKGSLSSGRFDWFPAAFFSSNWGVNVRETDAKTWPSFGLCELLRRLLRCM